MQHLVLENRTEIRKIPVRPRQGTSEKYQMIFSNPSCASYTVGAKVCVFNLETSVTKEEIEFNSRSKLIDVLWRINVWSVNLSNRAADTSVDAISVTVDSVLEAIDYGGASMIDISRLNFDFVNAEHLIAVLRTTFSWRDQVPGWRNALRAAPEILARHGLNSEEELFGLDVAL